MSILRCFVGLCTATAVVAQVPSISLSTATALSVRASTVGANESASLPAGTLGSQGIGCEAVSSGGADRAQARSTWAVNAFPTELRCDLLHELRVEGAAIGAAAADLGDLVVDLQAPSPMAVELSFQSFASLPAGTPAPVLRADIGDDGSFEVMEGQVIVVRRLVTLDVVPLRVRLRSQLALSGVGAASAGMWMAVKPVNNLQLQEYDIGCAPRRMQLRPMFDQRGVLLQGTLLGSVAVFGFQQQPQLVSIGAVANCLFLPSPDVVVVLPTLGSLVVPLPAAVRPITFWVQGVDLAAIGTTNAYRCSAL